MEAADDVELDTEDPAALDQFQFYVKTNGSAMAYDCRYHCVAEADDRTIACGRLKVEECTHVGSCLPDLSMLCKHCSRARPEVAAAHGGRLSCLLVAFSVVFDALHRALTHTARHVLFFIPPTVFGAALCSAIARATLKQPWWTAPSTRRIRHRTCRSDKSLDGRGCHKIYASSQQILACSRSRLLLCSAMTSLQ